MAKYRVEMKRYKDGTWYTKTETDYIGPAISVARCYSEGREYKVIDTETGRVIEHGNEDSGMKEYVTSKQ